MAKVGDIIENYTVVRMLGSGSSGEVVLAHENDDRDTLFAIKIISLKHIHRNHLSTQIKREISAMKSLHHENIVRLFRVLNGGTKLYLVCEYVSGGDLYDKIAAMKSLPETLARKYFKQIVRAIQHCHENGITHRDLKPENCMVTEDGDIKVADFGLSNITSQQYGDMFFTVCGTPHYASPEVLSRVTYNGPQSDIWSMGVLLYVMVLGYLPFDDDLHEALRVKIKHAKFGLPAHTISSEAEDLIRRILVIDPTKRPTLIQILEHSWLTDADDGTEDDEFSTEFSTEFSKECSTHI
ncbi:putative serine/threonine protein kinase [Tribonema minus]|uniref:Putative serine/threonine protein kinase n=1 Tax=Tribonema minus TaxID=303371 RepID=A0A835Z4H3_9STRA|nr:putative serine/threonine protein kinase [Tribonema minus]